MEATEAIITVRTPCTCGASRWFMCDCAETIARYKCDPLDGTGMPTPEHAQWVADEHPGMALCYVGPRRHK